MAADPAERDLIRGHKGDLIRCPLLPYPFNEWHVIIDDTDDQYLVRKPDGRTDSWAVGWASPKSKHYTIKKEYEILSLGQLVI